MKRTPGIRGSNGLRYFSCSVIDERDELGLALAPLPALPPASEFQRALVGLRSGVAEEDSRQPRSLHQALGELPLIRVVIKI